MWSFLQAVLMAITILLIHTYFGYFAQGVPPAWAWPSATRCGPR